MAFFLQPAGKRETLEADCLRRSASLVHLPANHSADDIAVWLLFLRAKYAMKFWRYIQCKLNNSGVEIIIAILDYKNANRDVVAGKQLAKFGVRISANVKEGSALPYLNVSHAHPGWYADVEKIVERVLITAGGAEYIPK
ncbi:hypothetical protein GALMADRAFT_278496 [Galerina marginata CBS 339.88]|uniref:Uncharacterized protein n=1 Tax=Galerina marginata (strain CBS 339.88) TaxID=685588 RepID=A0A067T759_GALM3|nr:hypothetical protein GALMADRAFT_278496 [Galerina marginata CBS 339.88]